MPGIVNSDHHARKRKREGHVSDVLLDTSTTEKAKPANEGKDEVKVHLLEEQILQSRRHYNNIATLVDYARNPQRNATAASQAIVALCRVFSRLMALGLMAGSHRVESEKVITDWLIERYREYTGLLLDRIENGHASEQNASMELLLQVSKEEMAGLKLDTDAVASRGTFSQTLGVLANAKFSSALGASFVEDYVQKYEDIVVYTFRGFANMIRGKNNSLCIDGIISMMTLIKPEPQSDEHTKEVYFNQQPGTKVLSYSFGVQQRAAQETWMLVLKGDISKAQRKSLLGVMSQQIVPWFTKPELLMDFLIDSYDFGGSTSLMALSGLFYLIQEKNLDYPQFYLKLYSLLDSSVLHSKHRSRFLRLLDTFLASTHLPAVLVASFIKRMSRLCLHSPPSGIVAIVPWIYNLLKKHPMCTFMIHREVHEADAKELLSNAGMNDPFRMDETDPNSTGAIDSSLWEIESLQSHYHPNVAMIARIISEQFTKQAYNVEDFLDHSYGSMLDAELSKPVKRAPVVEYEIPKRIFTSSDDPILKADSLLVQLWDFSS